ncbi:PKD domain-containing protein [Flavihumibacter sediminis]|nr:PKD domain-containing protein [Flavihumibacter sediminis]
MPPIAITGQAQVISLPTDSVILNGSESYDPDGKITKWRWTKIAGPSSFKMNRSDSAKTVVTLLEQGVYAFELKVTDDKGANGMDTLQVTVNIGSTTNQPPVACAGQDQIITLPVNSVLLDGTCSTDPDNNITSYTWTKISGPTSYSFENANAVKTQVYDLVEGSFLFELKVTDAEGLFSFDTVHVLVKSQIDNSSVDIYVTGEGNGVAKYWKNGQEVMLSNYAIGRAITVNGNDVYVAGEQGDYFYMDTTNIAMYWKNGQEVLLPSQRGAGATSIAVNGSDVYVTGWEYKGIHTVAKYWKNGQQFYLTDGSNNAEATCIVIVDDNVYIGGYEQNVAKYWKNGQEVLLEENAAATSIAVNGNDVYVSGWGFKGSAIVAKYWKNGEPVILTDGPQDNRATSITVSGNDVYVAGYEDGGNYTIAKYWKNGEEVTLSKGSNFALAFSIAVLGTNVYVAGYENETNGIFARIWKNGQPVPFALPNGSIATSIFLVPR